MKGNPWKQLRALMALLLAAAALVACTQSTTKQSYVAEGEDGSVLGYAGLHVAVDEGYIDNIAVQEAYRRQGVGEALLGAFIRFGKEKLAFLTLEVRPSNAPAIQFYMKHGFVQVGRRKNFYSAPKEDAILMTLEFEHGTEAAE